MATTKKIIQKDAQGNVIEVDIGANATNITQDSTHRFVTDTEKTIWNAKQNAITIDTALSSSSTNPVQNKIVNTALAGKASSSHTHSNYVNQNAFSNITVGSTTIAADSATDMLTLVAGSNVNLVADATNDKVTISATNTVYTHPTTSGYKHIPSGGSSGQILKWSANGTAYWASPYKQLEILGEYEITVDDWRRNGLHGYYMSEFPCGNADSVSYIFLELVLQDINVPGLDFASILAAKKAFECVDYVRTYGTSSIYFYGFTERPAKAFKCRAWAIR